MLQEASIGFASALNDAALRHFRESHRGVGDVSMAFLTTHMRIERWREALLWSWAVAKVGSSDGVWGNDARQEIRELLDIDGAEQGRRVKIRRAARDTLGQVVDNFQRAAWEPPMATEFRFCEQIELTDPTSKRGLPLDRQLPWTAISRVSPTFGLRMTMSMNAR